MDPRQFFAASRLAIVAGKGGVGKTTVTAALAVAAADLGLDVLVVEVEGKTGLAGFFDRPALDYGETVLCENRGPDGRGRVRARTITPDDALHEYLDDHGMRRLSRRLVASGALDVVATAAPGIDDILVLGKVKQLERGGAADVILLDAPAAGHALTFLQSARGLLDAVAVGPIHHQARDVLELLSDASRCQVILVTLPEETPVNELVDTAFALEDRVGVALGPIVVNGIYDDIAGLDSDVTAIASRAGAGLTHAQVAALRDAAEFRRARMSLQAEQAARLHSRLPLPQITLPYVFTASLHFADIEHLARRALAAIVEMAA